MPPVINTVRSGSHTSWAPPAATRVRRGTRTSPWRIAACGSADASTPATVPASTPGNADIADASSTSTSTKRPGFSDCAARTRPHTVAAARSVSESSARATTAPRVSTTRREPPHRSSASHRCIRSRTWAPSSCADSTTPAAGSETTSVSTASGTGPASTSDARSVWICKSPPGRQAESVPRAPTPSTATAPVTAGAGCGDTVHSRANSGSRPLPPGRSSAENGRSTRDLADSTDCPAASTALTETESSPALASRTRSTDAPAACRRTPPQENGNRPGCASSIPTNDIACNAASSRAGWTPNKPAFDAACSPRATSAKTSPLAPRQAARSPWNAGP
ncbi:hypothetical protein GCM10009556_038250 [Acrocarpospora pleiomorpha]